MLMVKKSTIALLCIVALLPVSKCSSGEITTEVMAGSEVDSKDQGFSYLGMVIGKPVNTEYAVIGRIFSGYLKYNFESAGKTLSAEVPILTPSIGIRTKRNDITLTGYAGLDMRRTNRETISGGEEHTDATGISIQGEMDMWGQGLRNLNIIANYSSIDSFFWGRVRAKKGVSEIGSHSNLLLGAEFVGMGNDDFTAAQAGFLLELSSSSPNLSLLLKGGYKYTSTYNDSIYGGLEFYYRH